MTIANSSVQYNSTIAPIKILRGAKRILLTLMFKTAQADVFLIKKLSKGLELQNIIAHHDKTGTLSEK